MPVHKEPSVLPLSRRFNKWDDRCSALGGDFDPGGTEVRNALHEIEWHIKQRRKKIWQCLRPSGMQLLNFPKLFYERD